MKFFSYKIIFSFLFAHQMYPLMSMDVYKKYEMPSDIRITLDAHQADIDKHSGVQEYPWLPGYFVKDEALDRLKGAAILKSAIAKYKTKHWDVATKYYYQKDILVAQKVIADEEKLNIGLDATKEFVKLLDTGFRDFNEQNIIKSNAKYIFIDTDVKAFDKNKLEDTLYRATRMYCFDKQAKAYLSQEFTKRYDS
jgi:hypothetical protein